MAFEPPLGDLSNQQDQGFRAGAALECCPAHTGVFLPGPAWEFAWDLGSGWISSRMPGAR